MEKEKKTPFLQWIEAESAVAPLDDVIAVLQHAYTDFNLGNVSLSKEEQFDLLHRYQTLGSLIMLCVDTLYRVVEDFDKCKPQKDGSDPEPTESAN